MKNTFLVILVLILAIVAIVFIKEPKSNLPIDSSFEYEKTFSENGRSFNYPENFGTKYISVVEWPPILSISTDGYSCVPSGSMIEASGLVEAVSANGNNYCLTRSSEGAAGSVYTKYSYSRDAGVETQTLSFTLRSVQCGNYDQPEQKTCQTERDGFDPLVIIDAIFGTLK